LIVAHQDLLFVMSTTYGYEISAGTRMFCATINSTDDLRGTSAARQVVLAAGEGDLDQHRAAGSMAIAEFAQGGRGGRVRRSPSLGRRNLPAEAWPPQRSQRCRAVELRTSPHRARPRPASGRRQHRRRGDRGGTGPAAELAHQPHVETSTMPRALGEHQSS
jgi:hypothetical protein